MELLKRVFRFEDWRVVVDWEKCVQCGAAWWVPLEGAEAGEDVGSTRKPAFFIMQILPCVESVLSLIKAQQQ